MASANNASYDTDLLEIFARRVMVGDGAKEIEPHGAVPMLDCVNDLDGYLEVRDQTRADIIDMIVMIPSEPAPMRSKRNTFGCNLVNQITHANANKVRELALVDIVIAERVEGARGDETGVRTSIR